MRVRCFPTNAKHNSGGWLLGFSFYGPGPRDSPPRRPAALRSGAPLTCSTWSPVTLTKGTWLAGVPGWW